MGRFSDKKVLIISDWTRLVNNQSEFLNIATYCRCSKANGPGSRFVIWLQGCRKKCNGCINPGFQAENTVLPVAVEEIDNQIKKTNNIEGVTFSGGEPFLQAEALTSLCRYLEDTELSIISYSGYTLEELQSSELPGVSSLISHLDVLIDGPYISRAASPMLWRGSSNQKVYFLTDRYQEFSKIIFDSVTDVEINLFDEELTTTGFWPAKLLPELKRQLEKDHA